MAEKEGIFKRNGVWYVRTDPLNGGKVSTRERTKKGALRWLHEREQEATRRETDPAYSAAKATLVDWCDTFLDRAEERGCSQATLSFYNQKLGHWVRFLGVTSNMSDVNQGNVDRFVSSRRLDRVSEHTISKECAVLVRMLKVAKRGGAWSGDLDSLIPEDVRPSYVPRSRALKMEEVTKLVAVARPYIAALVALSAGLGVRLSEAQKLTREDFSKRDGTVRIRGTKTEAADRVVPILANFRKLVDGALPLLPLGPYNCNLYRDLEVDCRRAGIEYCTPNDLRRSHATILLEFGVSPDVVRRLLGHTSEAMVRQVYGRTRPESLREQAEAAIGGKLDEIGTSSRPRKPRPRPSAKSKLPKTLNGEKSDA